MSKETIKNITIGAISGMAVLLSILVLVLAAESSNVNGRLRTALYTSCMVNSPQDSLTDTEAACDHFADTFPSSSQKEMTKAMDDYMDAYKQIQ